VEQRRNRISTSRHATLQRLAARIRGRQTIAGLLAGGLKSSGRFYMGADVYIDAGFLWAITIEDGVTLAHDVQIIAHDSSIRHEIGYTVVRPVVIASGAYLGAGARVLPGTTIGREAIIGAGAVVRQDVPERTLAVGNPARVIFRLDDVAARHRAAMETVPTFEVGPVAAGGATREQLDEMRCALERHGTIYVR
jgi:acetyltransferase-like isoleucine patch superfamily enzyme